jgi:Xaa-Pro aminopeptidase
MFAQRVDRARSRMGDAGLDVLLLSVGADLPYLTGYEAMPLERLTMLVLPRDDAATLVVPRLEAPRVVEHPDVFAIRPWAETEDPIAIVADLVGRSGAIAIGDRTWARFVLDLQRALPAAQFTKASVVMTPLRAVKDAQEVDALRAAAAAVDRVAQAMRDRPFAGRAEADVSRELIDRMLVEGHSKPNFAIVGSGPNAASPHHEPGERIIQEGDTVVCDFGGTMAGYCSDITRTFSVGPPAGDVAEAYAVLRDAQERAVQAAVVGSPCESVDAAARDAIAAAGFGDYFIHRTGHGIGLEEHEDPYMVQGNHELLEPGHAFSVEPGIYIPGKFGMRLEDIVVATTDGPVRLNNAPHDMAVVG